MISYITSRHLVLAGAASAFLLVFTAYVLPSHAQDGGFCPALLSAHPDGGAGLSAEVQNLVAAAPDVAEDVLGCAGAANKAQAQALGAGLSKVVEGLKTSNPALADKIAALVAGSENETLKTAFAGGSSDEATAANTPAGDGADDGAAEAAPGGDALAGPGFGSGPTAPSLIVGSSGGGTGGGSVSPN